MRGCEVRGRRQSWSWKGETLSVFLERMWNLRGGSIYQKVARRLTLLRHVLNFWLNFIRDIPHGADSRVDQIGKHPYRGLYSGVWARVEQIISIKRQHRSRHSGKLSVGAVTKLLGTPDYQAGIYQSGQIFCVSRQSLIVSYLRNLCLQTVQRDCSASLILVNF